jgi:hypothetical protein
MKGKEVRRFIDEEFVAILDKILNKGNVGSKTA